MWYRALGTLPASSSRLASVSQHCIGPIQQEKSVLMGVMMGGLYIQSEVLASAHLAYMIGALLFGVDIKCLVLTSMLMLAFIFQALQLLLQHIGLFA